jgi:hypothetical protein
MIKIKNKIHKRAKSLNTDQAWTLFRQHRNTLTNVIRKKKLDYLNDLDKRASSSESFGTKNWWKLVKSFLSKKGSNPDTIPPLEKDGIVYYTNIEKATKFNEFFINQSNIEDNTYVPDIPELNTSINQIHLTIEDVKSTLTQLNSTKATGPDQIHNIILKASAGIISEHLTFLFNRSLNEGIFPAVWKTAHVTPIHKKGNKELCTNYRPISLLSCVGKTLEKCVQRHVLGYLNINQIITKSQSGFIEKDSTVYQLLGIYDDFCRSFDSEITTQAIFFDISKAFDKVWHRGLLRKLHAIGIRETLLKWFEDYLTERKQAVVLYGSTSNYLTVHAGVPQGSVLGPLLFLIYINDIVQDIESIIKLFADDTSMYLCLENSDIRAEILNSDLDKITQWASKWKVTFNESKTELINISRNKNHQFLPLNFGRSVLDNIPNHTHLGIIFQNNCKWENHIKTLIAKCRTQVACLKSYKYRLSRKSLDTMYKSFILPQLDYADVVWNNCSQKLSEDLESLQLDAIRTITGAVRGTSHQKLYNDSGYVTLKERRLRHKIIMYHKIVHEKTPTYLNAHIPPLVSSINPYHRRRPLQRQVPQHKTEVYKQSFFPSTTILWNDLPESIQRTTSISQVKRYLSINDKIVPNYYFNGNRQTQVIHCKLRLGMSDLHYDLLNRHLTASSTCDCGERKETTEHYILHCPHYSSTRDNTIHKLPAHFLNISTLLRGDINASNSTNSLIFKAVQDFILLSGRFVLERRT